MAGPGYQAGQTRGDDHVSAPTLGAWNRYSDEELDEWAARFRGLAAEADTTGVVFNNCYRDYAHVNAQQLTARLGPLAAGRG